MAPSPNSLEGLPDEILEMIISHLDIGCLSLSNVHDEPSSNLTRSPAAPLKALSRTSRHFRSFTTLSLFRHCRVDLTELSFKDPYNLSEYSHKPRFSEVEDFLRFLAAAALAPAVQTLLLYTSQDLGHKVPGLLPVPHAHIVKFELGDFWPTLFASVRPAVLTICAPPPTLAFFTSCGIYVGDAWAFSTPFHLLQLRLPAAGAAAGRPPADRPAPAPTGKLFAILPWTHCTLNEGSSLQVYHTYEYHAMVAPSIFNGRLRDTPASPPRALTALATFDYVAIFPLYGQVVKVLSFLFILPRLRTITTRLAPKRENKTLEDVRRVLRTLFIDLWIESENTYFMIAKEIVQAEKRSDVRELVCLDYQREGLWESCAHGGEVMNQQWVSVGRGHWIKEEAEEAEEEDTASPGSESLGTGHTQLPGVEGLLRNDAMTYRFLGWTS